MGDKIGTLQSDSRYEGVKQYYGEALQETSDLKTDACCTPDSVPAHIRAVLPLISEEVKRKYYGCGSPVPLCIDGSKVLDLGCGSGRDCYVMSKLVGEDGFVHGIDMTEKQIAVAQKYVGRQMQAFGYSKTNVNFIFDYIETLPKHFEQQSLDLVTSNCAINLTEDKTAILEQIYDALRFGGEMYFADIYADRRVPEDISRDSVLRGECLGGAMYYKDFEKAARRVGFADPRIYSRRVLNINNPEIQKLVGNTKFCSVTYRLWKLEGLEESCEDYGHVAVYDGQIPQSPFKFQLDDGHIFYKNKPERVCGNTALMLSQTRFSKYFEVMGTFDEHFGAFEGCSRPGQENDKDSAGSCCCS